VWKYNYWQGYRENGALAHCSWKCKLVQPFWKHSKFLRILKIKLLYDPAISLLCIYPKEMKVVYWRDLYSHIYCFIHNSQVSISWSVDKENVVYYSPIKEGNHVTCDMMKLVGISKIIQAKNTAWYTHILNPKKLIT
jgi:hypothetical protein